MLVLFAIGGMTCGACSASITDAVSALSGVTSVSVSLLTDEAKIVYDEKVISPEQIKLAIEDCGFDAQVIKSSKKPIKSSMKKTHAPPQYEISGSANSASIAYNTTVHIDGMTCGACSASITEAVEKLPGVELVSVSLVTESGLIKHTSEISKETIRLAIEDCGFDVTIEKSKMVSSTSSPSSSVSNNDVSGAVDETTLAISGMTCAACTASVSEALEQNPAISLVSVSLLTEEARVCHSEAILPDEIKSLIEDCGFGAEVTKTVHKNVISYEDVNEPDEISLQIYGISELTDTTSLQFNIEAYLNSVPGIIDFNLAFKYSPERANIPSSTYVNSSTVRSVVSPQEIPENEENLIDELQITYDPLLIGIRFLVDGLNDIATDIHFIIINSVDQSSVSQLRLLSRVKDIQYWRNNFFQALFLGIPVIVLSNTQKIPFWKHMMIFPGLYVVSLLQFVLAVPVQFKLGAVFNKKFLYFVKNGGKNATMDVLVCISSLVSFIFSAISLVLSVWSGQEMGPPKLLFDTACMLILFISFGKWLENKAKGATSTALSKLLSLTPTNCTIVSDTASYESFLKQQEFETKSDVASSMLDFPTKNVSIDLLQSNDIAVVLPGAKVPADGIVVYGASEIDESIITGESLPVYKLKNEQVIGGSINGSGLIHMKVVRAGKKSRLQQIINLVKESQVNKAPVQRFSDYIAARFVPVVLLLAAITFAFWVVLCYNQDKLPMAFTKDENGKFFVCLKIAISVIVVACPCALGLAAPTAVMVGTGIGASHGVLIKGADILERANSINVILFDKTGTLTTGDMTLVKYKQISTSNLSENDWWTLVGSVESNSEHPVGRAICKSAKGKLSLNFDEDIFDSSISEFKVLMGLGIKANVQLPNAAKYDVHVGNHRMVDEMFPDLLQVIHEHFSSSTDSILNSVNTLSFVIINGQYAGYLEFTDSLKPNAKEVIHYLKTVEGYQVGMVTGDSNSAARRIGLEVGIPESNIFSEVSPVHKDAIIVDIKERLGGDKNVGIAFVGDGINDAPALAQADIGMAISSGTDIAIESADIVLIGGNQGHVDLSGVLNALNISNATFRRIKINFVWAAVYNMIMLPFAMGCFLPFNVMLPPIAAAGAMMLSSVSVVLSSLLLKRWKAPNTSFKHVSWKVDLENDAKSEEFSLKTGTLEDFNAVKRNGKSKYRVGKFLTTFNIGRYSHSSTTYELVPNASH